MMLKRPSMGVCVVGAGMPDLTMSKGDLLSCLRDLLWVWGRGGEGGERERARKRGVGLYV
jgi:hypothetical protein